MPMVEQGAKGKKDTCEKNKMPFFVYKKDISSNYGWGYI